MRLPAPLELERRQTEWNALHYQILQRLVTEVSRTSIEMQSLSLRVEALSARVDFNDRRVRTLETIPAADSQPAAAGGRHRGARRPHRRAATNESRHDAGRARPDDGRTKTEASPPARTARFAAWHGVERKPDGRNRRDARRRSSDVEEGDDEDTLEVPAAMEPASEDLSAAPASSADRRHRSHHCRRDPMLHRLRNPYRRQSRRS